MLTQYLISRIIASAIGQYAYKITKLENLTTTQILKASGTI